MDMDMSVSGGDVSADYSDYEYQSVSAQLILNEGEDATGDTSARSSAQAEFEPLSTVAGLDNNEVAELVHLEVIAALEHENEGADQTLATASEFRGNVGINLPPTGSSFVDNNSTGQNAGGGNLFNVNDISEDNVFIQTAESTEDRILQHFKAVGSPPFDDSANGNSGANYSSVFHAKKNFRDLVGRGPVLDSTDAITTLLSVNAEDTVMQILGDLKLQMIWDVAEVSDAGRAFSVPDGM